MEANPAGTGYHAHAVQRGSYIPQAALQEACHAARAGIPYINLIRGSASASSRYGLKGYGAAGYGLKTYGAQSSGQLALALNNGRLEHHSPAFFHIDGEKRRVREVESHAVASLTDYRQPPQVVTSARQARHLLSRCGDEDFKALAKITRQIVRQ